MANRLADCRCPEGANPAVSHGLPTEADPVEALFEWARIVPRRASRGLLDFFLTGSRASLRFLEEGAQVPPFPSFFGAPTMNHSLLVSLFALTPLAIQPGFAQETVDAFGSTIKPSSEDAPASPISGRPSAPTSGALAPTPDGAPYQQVQARTSFAQPLAGQTPATGEIPRDASSRPYPGTENQERMHYAERDGAIWSLGKNYKASADSRGFTFIPFLGSDAPKNYPVQFRLDQVTLGGQSLSVDQFGGVTRNEDRIVIDRGPVDVWYDMSFEQVEQSFALQVPPTNGELVVRIAVETELALSEIADGVRYANERGGMNYTHALVYDGAGQRLELPIVASQGSIELRVPASYMANAQAPVVVDPLLGTYGVDSANARNLQRPDVAYSQAQNVFAYCHTSVWSATDRDCRVETYGGNSNALENVTWIDFSSTDWNDGVIASDAASDSFLVAGLVDNGAGFLEVLGITLNASDLAQSPEFLIGDINDTGSTWTNVDLDVGGQFNATSRYKVVWQRNFDTLSQSAIRTRDVIPVFPHSTVTAPSVGLTFALEGSASLNCFSPKISKSTGLSTHSEWRVVYNGEDPNNGDQTIRGARYDQDSTLLAFPSDLSGVINPAFTVQSLDISTGLDSLSGPFAGGAIYCMPVYYSGPSGADVYLYALEGENLFGEILLTNREHKDVSLDQAFPAVSSLSDRFLVPYQEFEGGIYSTKVTIVDFTNLSSFGINERRLPMATTGANFSGYAPGIASRFSGGFTASRWAGVATEVLIGAEWDMQATVVAGTAARTPGQQYCVGAPNSTGDYGFITMFGSENTTSIKTLSAEALPLNQFAYFLAGQGGFSTVQPPGSAGFLCLIGGPIGRYNLGIEILFTGTSGEISLNIDPTALRGPGGDVAAMAGQTWNFQAWHREDGGSSNFTNAISLLFE